MWPGRVGSESVVWIHELQVRTRLGRVHTGSELVAAPSVVVLLLGGRAVFVPCGNARPPVESIDTARLRNILGNILNYERRCSQTFIVREVLVGGENWEAVPR